MTARRPGQTASCDESAVAAELVALREENARLRATSDEAFHYIRAKIDELLTVLGTRTMRPEELDNQSLIALDPIGIVATTFRHVLETLRDTNRQLQSAHGEIRAIFDTVGAALLVIDPRRRIVSLNRQALSLMNANPDSVLGQDCSNVVCGLVDPPPERCIFQQVLASGQTAIVRGKRLRDQMYDVLAGPIFDGSGKISHVVMAYQDVTAHRRAETDLRHSLAETREAQAKIRGILRAAADGLLLTDGRGRIVLVNHRAEQLFGLGPIRTGELPSFRIIRHEGLVDMLRRAPHHHGEMMVEDLDFTGMTGQEHVSQARVTIIRGARGGFRGCITSLHDVTEQRRVERMKSEFVSTAAHELRTPLATIMGYADLLLHSPEQSRENLRDFLGVILSRAEHLSHIVSDLLDISRIEAGEGLKLAFQSCRLDLLCREVAWGHEDASEQHPFEFDLPVDGVCVEGDRYALTQVIENLLSNAIKYSPHGGKIRISLRPEENYCELAVADEGIGMTQAQLDHVFEKFYRANSSDTGIPGTGLGMTIVKHLIDAHHGQIVIDSNPGVGTTVKIRLPQTHVTGE